jgi:hypothetical protein
MTRENLLGVCGQAEACTRQRWLRRKAGMGKMVAAPAPPIIGDGP